MLSSCGGSPFFPLLWCHERSVPPVLSLYIIRLLLGGEEWHGHRRRGRERELTSQCLPAILFKASSGEEQAGIHLPACCHLGREPGCAAEASLLPSFLHSRGGLYLQSPTGEGLAPTEQEMLKGSQTSHVKRDLIAPEPKVDSFPQLSLVSTALVRHQQGNRTRCMQVTPKLLQQS